jgi:hypothetical protein
MDLEMTTPNLIIAATWSEQLADVFSTENLQLLLLIGSGILAISLLVLALTRWGHSRPVWKCVILSFVAHILLIGYAYGTRMIFDTPAVVKAEPMPMRVNLIEEVGESLTGDDRADSTEKRWDQFVNEQAMPALDNLERPAIDSEVVIEKTIDRAVQKPTPTPGSNIETVPQKFESPQFAETPTKSNNDFHSTPNHSTFSQSKSFDEEMTTKSSLNLPPSRPCRRWLGRKSTTSSSQPTPQSKRPAFSRRPTRSLS